jgi:hypothetical protein
MTHPGIANQLRVEGVPDSIDVGHEASRQVRLGVRPLTPILVVVVVLVSWVRCDRLYKQTSCPRPNPADSKTLRQAGTPPSALMARLVFRHRGILSWGERACRLQTRRRHWSLRLSRPKM